MAFRRLALLVAVLALSQIVRSGNANLSVTGRDTASDELDVQKCTFEGNSDFYGIGVRIGFYLTWLSGWIDFVFNPGESEGQADAQTIFLIANLVSILVLQQQSAAKPPGFSTDPDQQRTPLVVPILLFYMFFGGSVVAATSATASWGAWKTAKLWTRKIGIVARQIAVQATFVAMLIYSFYFWTRGFEKFLPAPQSCSGIFVFPIYKRVIVRQASAGAVIALLLLVVVYGLTWFVSYKRLRRSFGEGLRPLKYSQVRGGDEQLLQLPPWHPKQRPWTIGGGVLLLFVILWSMAGIELTIRWNKVTGVNAILSTGQLIPFVIGVASLPAALWAVVEYKQEVKEDEHKFTPGPTPTSAGFDHSSTHHGPYSPGYGDFTAEIPMEVRNPNGSQVKNDEHPLLHHSATAPR